MKKDNISDPEGTRTLNLLLTLTPPSKEMKAVTLSN